MSTGAPALVLVADAPASVAMLVVGLEAGFSKKAVGETVFTCEDLPGMRAAIEAAAASSEPRTFVARAIGRDAASDEVAAFEITWSFKRRSSG